MHIAFDVSQTGAEKAGCGYFADALIRAMLDIAPTNWYTLLPNFGDFYFNPHMPLFNPFKNGSSDYGPRHLTRNSVREFWNRSDLQIQLKNPDIIHSNNFWSPQSSFAARFIYTFYDMGFVVNPEWTTEANRIGCFEGVFRSSMVADWVVAISEASKKHYLEIFPHYPSDRISVIYPSSRFINTKVYGKPPPAMKALGNARFWLSVGTIEPRKNQKNLAEAYAKYLALGGDPIPLVFAGGAGWLMDDFEGYLKRVGVFDSVILTGYVSDEELIWLYKNCYANLYPSWFEGFGLPILEGMQFGAPSVCSDRTSLPEVAGNAAILLSPDDIDEWAYAMLRLSKNQQQRDRMALLAVERAKFFNWDASAKQLLSLYENVLGRPKR